MLTSNTFYACCTFSQPTNPPTPALSSSSSSSSRQVFRSLDKDASGSLTTEEMKVALKRYNVGGSRGPYLIERLVNECDPDGSGEIGYDEFAQMLKLDDKQIDSVFAGHNSGHQQAIMAELEKKAERVKLNANPEVKWDVESLREAIMGRIYLQNGSLRKVFRRIDKDASGIIDFPEMQENFKNYNIGGANYNETLREMFDRCDPDGSGEISFAEFAQMLKIPDTAADAVYSGYTQHERPVYEREDGDIEKRAPTTRYGMSPKVRVAASPTASPAAAGGSPAPRRVSFGGGAAAAAAAEPVVRTMTDEQANEEQFAAFKARVIESVVNCHTDDDILNVLNAMMGVQAPNTEATVATRGAAGAGETKAGGEGKAGGGGGGETAPFGIQLTLNTLKQSLAAHGARGIHGLGRKFRIIDDDGSGKLSFAEFKKALKEHSLGLTEKNMKELFRYFDADNSGGVSYDEFLVGVRGALNDRRRAMVAMAFKVIDKDGSGELDVSDIVGTYDASKHPDVLAGRKTESEVFREFLDTFDGGSNNKGDGIVTPKEFEEYYANVSASIDDDDYFELMMRNAWHISGGEGWCANTSNRRVHVKFADGRQGVEEVPNDMSAGNDPDKIKANLEAKYGAGSITAVSLTGEFEDGDEGAGPKGGSLGSAAKSRGTPGGDSSFVFG